MKTMTALILMIVLALAGYAYSANGTENKIEPVNRYFDHTGRYYRMDYYR